MLAGKIHASNAQTLMRSRYSAYCTIQIDYLLQTTHPSVRKNYVANSMEEWARSSDWQKLEILSRTRGGENDDRGEVEFKAYYLDSKKNLIIHHENSEFVKENERWYYLKGALNPAAKLTSGKTNRNDPCPCGSGLKYKKCCG
jgi:SEC-C motif-containing protein